MKDIYVTSPLLPPLEEFIPYLEKIWDNKNLTNGESGTSAWKKSWLSIWAWSICVCLPMAPWHC